MGELAVVEGTKQVTLTNSDFISLVIIRLAQRSGLDENDPAQTTHEFCDGLYARTLTVKKGQIVVGAIHSTESFLVVRSGHALIAGNDNVIEVKAGFQTVVGVGKMNIGYALEDTVFTNYIPNPGNVQGQDALWELNTFAVDEETWKSVDAYIDTMLTNIQAQEIE